MLFTTGNLITLGIVAVVLIIYRQLDRDNRSLEMVKKYAEKLKDELSVYVDKRSEDLQRYSIEVEVQQKAAKEVLKRLQTVEENLNNRAEAIGKIESRLSDYDTALSRLSDMTAKADENLSRLHEENEFTDSVAAKLAQAEKAMAAIEAEMPALKEGFTRENQAAIADFKEQVLSDMGKRIDDTRTTLENAQAAAEASLAKAESGREQTQKFIDQAFAAARAESEKLEDSAFEKLKESSDAKAARLKEAIEEKFREIGQAAKDRAVETQTLVKNMRAESKAETEEQLAAGRAGTEALIAQNRAETEACLAGGQKLLEDAKAQSESLLATIADSVKTRSDELSARLDAADAKLAQVESSYEDKSTKLETKAETLLTTMSEKFKAALTKEKEEYEHKAAETKAEALSALAEFKAAAASAAADAKQAKEERTAEAAKFDAEGKAREAAFFASVEKRLNAYNSEIEEKFAKLEAVNVDIAALESALRDSMAQAQQKVESDFAAFGSAFRDRNTQFEAGFGAETAKLRESMGALETELDALKSRAYDNVSEKLKVFEDDFFADLKTRSDSIDTRLASWKAELDQTLAGLATKTQEERADAEKASLEELKNHMADTQARVLEQLDKMRERVQGISDGIEAQGGLATESLEALKTSVQQDAQDARKTAQAYVEGELSKFSLDMQNQIKAAEGGLNGQLATLAAAVAAESGRITKTREDTEAACAVYRDSFSKTLAEADAKVHTDFDAFKTATSSLSESLKAEYEKERDSYMGEAQAQRDRLTKDLAGLADRTAELRQDLSSRINQAMQEFSRNYENLLADSAKKQKEAEAAADAKLRDFHDAAQDLALSIETARAQSLGKVEEQTAKLSQTLAEIDKEQKAFIAESKVFARTDELKASLADSINTMKAEIAGLDQRKAEIAEIENQLGKVKRLQDDVNQKVTRFMAEKRRVDALEEDFGKLSQVSDTVDKKIEEVTGQSDALTEAQAKIQKILDLANESSAKLERLEKKNEVIDATTDAVDKNFQSAQGLEKLLAGYGTQIGAFPDQLADIRKRLDAISADKPKIDEAAAKLGELDGIISDAEKRIAEAQKAREWLARAETRFDDLNRQAEEQLKVLSTIMKSDDNAKREESGSKASASVRDTVRRLARQGWKNEEIARAVKISLGEVELILELGEKK